MSKQERWVVAGTLLIIFVMVGVDLLNDSGEGVALWHVLIEGSAGLAALFGLFYLLRGTFSLKRRLDEEQANFSAFKQEAEQWRAESRKYVDGLSKAIDQQLTKWNLTAAEKEVAFPAQRSWTQRDRRDQKDVGKDRTRAVHRRVRQSGTFRSI